VLPPATAILLVFACWVGFSHVLFNQYFVWVIPWLPLAAAEIADRPRRKGAGG